MDDAAVGRWTESAMAVRDAAMRSVEASAGRKRSMLRSEMPKLAAVVPAGFPRWTPDVAAAVADFFDARADEDRPYGGAHMTHSFSLKCARIGWALAGGDLSALLPSDVPFLEASGLAPAGKRLPRPGGGAGAPPAGEGFPVDFRLSFAQPTTPRSTVSAHRALASGVAWVARVGADEAPVAWTLSGEAVPGTVEVRRIGDALFRPVMRPGIAEPVGEAGFAEACGSLDAWRDSPFVAPTNYGTAALAEYARPPTRMAPRDAQDVEAAVARALRRAGRLVSIGGVVHRETPPPMLRVVAVNARRRRGAAGGGPDLCLAWEVAGLRMGEPQAPMVPEGTFDVVLGAEDYGSRKGLVEAMLAVPASCPDVAEALGRRLAGLLGVGFVSGATATPPGPVDRPDPASVVAAAYGAGRPAHAWVSLADEMRRVSGAYGRGDARAVRALARRAKPPKEVDGCVRAALVSTLADAMDGAFDVSPFRGPDVEEDETYALVP